VPIRPNLHVSTGTQSIPRLRQKLDEQGSAVGFGDHALALSSTICLRATLVPNISEALDRLLDLGLARCTSTPTAGRSREDWSAV